MNQVYVCDILDYVYQLLGSAHARYDGLTTVYYRTVYCSGHYFGSGLENTVFRLGVTVRSRRYLGAKHLTVTGDAEAEGRRLAWEVQRFAEEVEDDV